MLYERWRDIARDYAREVAVRDAVSNQTITFADLASAIERASAPQSEILFPQGHNLDFVRTVLLGWKHGRIICPLEQGQPPPAVGKLSAKYAHLKLTSATTGPSRLIAFREEQLFADPRNIVSTMGLRLEWPNVGFISLAHSYGFSNLVLPLLLFGIPLTLATPPLPETLRAVAKQMDAFTLPAVPALWQAWHEAGAIPQNVRLAISAGAPLPLALENDVFNEASLKIHNFYGASECGGIAYDRSDKPRTDAALAGEALDNVTLQQTPEDLLVVSGPAVAETYWPESNARLKNDTFLTSDLVELASGRVYLRGRATDLINVAGRKVLPEPIEDALLRHPAVRDCVVFGMPDADSGRGECIAACVVAGTSEKDLREFLLAKMPAWQVPRVWRFVDALPRNERGKISRAELRRAFLQ